MSAWTVLEVLLEAPGCREQCQALGLDPDMTVDRLRALLADTPARQAVIDAVLRGIENNWEMPSAIWKAGLAYRAGLAEHPTDPPPEVLFGGASHRTHTAKVPSCSTCGDNRHILVESTMPTADVWRPCPVCAVPSDATTTETTT